MEVISLVGKSGTGKSHHAVFVAKKENADAIIDDGLLIISNKVAAGKSAKRESTKIASVKRAFFNDENHAKEVSEAIKKHKIKKILILGTSEKMTERISMILLNKEVDRHIHIEDIASQQEIEKARRIRMTEGKHTIPVPTLEIKKDFSGYFLHPLKLFKRNRMGSREQIADKTIVRPTYSYMGDYTISDNVIVEMICYEALRTVEVRKVSADILNHTSGQIDANLIISFVFGTNIKAVCREITQRVTKQINKVTAISVCNVKITVKEFVFDNQEE